MKMTRTLAWSIWSAAAIFYAYQYVLRIMPNIMIDDIMGKFSMGEKIFGQFSGIYYIGYAIMHLPIGIALDRFGPKKIMPLCILLTVAGMLPLIMPIHAVFPIVGRLLLGIGSSAAALCALKVIRMAFDPKKFTRMLSFIITIGLLGAIYGGAPLSSMHKSLGYENVIIIFMGVGIILAMTSYFLIPDISSKNHTPVMLNLTNLFQNKRVMLLALSAGLLIGPLEGFADVWGAKFLTIFYGFEPKIAKPLPSFIFVGMCFGAPFLGFIAEKTDEYVLTIIAAGFTMFVLFSLLMGQYLDHYSITLSFIVVGVCSSYQILCLYQVSTYVKPEITGLATTFTNMIIMFFGYFFHSIIGVIISSLGGANDAKAIVYGLIIIPIALGLGTLGFISLYKKDKRFKTA